MTKNEGSFNWKTKRLFNQQFKSDIPYVYFEMASFTDLNKLTTFLIYMLFHQE